MGLGLLLLFEIDFDSGPTAGWAVANGLAGISDSVLLIGGGIGLLVAPVRSRRPWRAALTTTDAASPGFADESRRLRLAALTSLPLILALLTLWVGIDTAQRWTKVDDPGHPETFRQEVYKTGKNRLINTGSSLCDVGQSWSGCADAIEGEWRRACSPVGAISDGRYAYSPILWQVEHLHPDSLEVCESYADEISSMRAQSWDVVTSLGSFGRLSKTPVRKKRKVSNGDYRAPVTHTATCYLGFLGECA